jgi:murein DD-endopeptidase MepM/ murein hydrolase activator NlpD
MIKKKSVILILLVVALAPSTAYARSTAEALNRIYHASLATVSKDSLEKKLIALQEELHEQKVILKVNETTKKSDSFADKSLQSRKTDLTTAVDNFAEVRSNYLNAVRSGDLNQMIQWEHSYTTSITSAGSLARLSADSVSTFNSTNVTKVETKDLAPLQTKIDSVNKEIATTTLLNDYDYGVLPTSLPVNGPILSGFGMRVDPISGDLKFHNGVDIQATVGTPVSAWFSGTVVVAEENNETKGNNVLIALGDVKTSYLHLSKIAVKEGQQVKQGDVIGYVGSSGRSTGPHLHLGLSIQGNDVDPALILGGE